MADHFYQNFEAALLKLGEFCDQFDGSEIQRAGIIQAFEFTYEQCWKALQKKAGSEGVAIASPKRAFEWAMQMGWISEENESIWIEILSDRNLTTHTYRKAIAIQVSDNAMKAYRSHFGLMLDHMKNAPSLD